MSDWLESMKRQEEELVVKTVTLEVSGSGDSEEKIKTDKNVSAAYAETAKDPPPDEDGESEEAKASLLRKMLRRCLVQGPEDSLEIIRRDPKSPLFSVTSFEELKLKPELLRGIYKMGFMTPSKIQETALPNLIGDQKSNIIAQSQSGTGKTAAFVLTMLSRVDTNKPYTQCICLAPTYELALQIGQVTEKMGQFIQGLQIGYGVRGQRVQRGTRLPYHILIGTPGTVMDWCLKFNVVDLSKIQVFVLDEADIMIDKTGHVMHTVRIRERLPRECQILLFSATYNEEVRKYATRIVPDPIVIRLKREEETLDNIGQYYIECLTIDEKFNAICSIYMNIAAGQAVIFCATRSCAGWLTKKMHERGHTVALLSGELTVEQRAAVINRFREGKEKVLISTNVSSRGIDVEGVGLVVNFDLPTDQSWGVDFETYLHRIGRTGRFGMRGVAINLVDGPESMQMVAAIQSHFGREILKLTMEDLEDMDNFARWPLKESPHGY